MPRLPAPHRQFANTVGDAEDAAAVDQRLASGAHAPLVARFVEQVRDVPGDIADSLGKNAALKISGTRRRVFVAGR